MFGSGLRDRRLQPELMDQPGLPEDDHRTALRALARINLLSGSARILRPALTRLARRLAPQPCRVLDVATGGGDVLLGLHRRARKDGVDLRLEGCDLSPQAMRLAERQAADVGADIRFFPRDVLKEGLPEGYDAVISSLFLHHLAHDAAVELLRRMAGAARHLVLVNDLERSRLGYLLAWLGTRLLTRSPIVHVDGPRSVEGAFTTAEALALARTAGLDGATVARRWPCRYLLCWERTT